MYAQEKHVAEFISRDSFSNSLVVPRQNIKDSVFVVRTQIEMVIYLVIHNACCSPLLAIYRLAQRLFRRHTRIQQKHYTRHIDKFYYPN